MRRALALAVFAAAAAEVSAAPKAHPDAGQDKAPVRDGGSAQLGLVGFVGTGDGGSGDAGTPFTGFVLGRALSAKGDLSKDEIKGVVKAHHGEINACYQALLERSAGKKPLPQGTAKLQFEVAPDGKVVTAAVAPGGLDEAKFVSCVVEHVQKWVFPLPRGGGPVKVTYPVNLLPPD